MNAEERINQGHKAQEILDNEVFQAAFDGIEREVIEQWTNSPARDVEGREKCWQYLMLLRKVRTHLVTTLETGKLANLELRHKQTLLQQVRTGIGL